MNTKTKRLVEYYGKLESLMTPIGFGHLSIEVLEANKKNVQNYLDNTRLQRLTDELDKFWPDFSDGAAKEVPQVEVTVRDVCGIKVYETKNNTDWDI